MAVARFDRIPLCWFSAAVFQEILHKEEQGERRALLDCCGCGDSGGPVSSTGRHIYRRIEGVWYGNEQVVLGASWAGHADCCLVLFVVCDHAEGSAAAYTPNER